MRLIFGIILGVALTFGAVFFHDNNVPPGPPSLDPAERRIVNWDVLGAVVEQWTDAVRSLWGDNRP